MLVEVKNVCTRVVCHRRLSRLSAPQPSLGGCGRCWPAVCWGLDSLRAQLPLLQLHSLCHPGACVVAATFGPGTTEALSAPSQADSKVRVSQRADGRTKEGCRLTLVGTPGSRRNIRIQDSTFLILFNRIQTVNGEIYFFLAS